MTRPLRAASLATALSLSLLGACGPQVDLPFDAGDLSRASDGAGEGLDPAVVNMLEARLEAVRSEPDSAAAMRSLGLACETSGSWDLAIQALEAALVLDPKDQGARLHLAICLHEAGRYDEELAALQEVTDREPSNLAALYRFGVANLDRGRFDEALISFQTLAALKPDLHQGHLGVGQVLLEQEKPEQALTHLDTARGRAGGDPFVEFAMGQCLADLGREQEAAAFLTRGADAKRTHIADPLNAELSRYVVGRSGLLQRALRLHRGGDLSGARRILADLAEEYPDDTTILGNLGSAQRELGLSDEAEVSLSRAVELEPDLYAAWFNLASTHLDVVLRERKETGRVAGERLTKALEAANEAVRHGGHLADMHEVRAKVHTLMNEGERALVDYQRAIDLGTDHQETYLAVARLQVLQGNREGAFVTLDEGASRHPDWVEVRIQSLPILVDRRDAIGARRVLGEVRSLVPDDPRLGAIQDLLESNGL
ncbi:MAG: tetratricopeptide repeat protein [Planctomycetes bacterium]|nr:tetratricopeptide repeat protein [Planctomycetota bacterium]MDA0947435.1 tetratricopeptide repeat protein [Planctomycetota bacterium]